MSDDITKMWADELPKLTMKIKQVIVSECPFKHVVTKLNWLNTDPTWPARSVRADLRTLDDPDLKGLMPSRVWHDSIHGLMFAFYTSPSIPVQGRPFQDGPTYILVLEPGSADILEYDLETRLFIDQVPTPDGIKYVILFGQEQYDKVVK